MKRCTYCGRENENDAIHCRECGTSLVGPSANTNLQEPGSAEIESLRITFSNLVRDWRLRPAASQLLGEEDPGNVEDEVVPRPDFRHDPTHHECCAESPIVLTDHRSHAPTTTFLENSAQQTGCSEPRDSVSVACQMSVARVAEPVRSC